MTRADPSILRDTGYVQGKHSGATQRVPINPRRDFGEDLWDCGRSEDLGGETSWFAGRIVANVMPSGQMVVSIAEVVAVVAIEGGELYGAITFPAFFARDFPWMSFPTSQICCR